MVREFFEQPTNQRDLTHVDQVIKKNKNKTIQFKIIEFRFKLVSMTSNHFHVCQRNCNINYYKKLGMNGKAIDFIFLIHNE